eukprot:TRINITY_DN748_c0_g2_i1.p1 TRINITY_DN748_c0_g2~~TRINITY_DN748_c0_g2_i1.p1  ORF type:complete len:685 (+),score=199.84 TRINITY_DN748_c0_g2_i1:55-2109(+)
MDTTNDSKSEPKKNLLERKNRSLSQMAEFITSSPLLAKRYRNGSLINNDHCEACGEGGSLLCCEDCPKSFHFVCLDPPITEIPEEAWFCRSCYTKKHTPHKKHTPLSQLVYQIDCSNSDTFYLPSSLINEITVEGEPIPSPTSKVRTTKKKRLHDEHCFVCNINSGQFLDCSKCKKSFHLYCLDPPLLSMPTGKWICGDHKEKKSNLMAVDIKKNFVIPQVLVPLRFLPTTYSPSTIKSKRKSLPIKSENGDKQIAMDLLNEMHKNAMKEDQKAPVDDNNSLSNQTLIHLKRFVNEAVNLSQKEREERKYWETLSTASNIESIPDYNKLSNATMEEINSFNPLFVQFLAWQRLVHLNSEKKNNKDMPISHSVYKPIDQSNPNVHNNNLNKSSELQRRKNFIEGEKKQQMDPKNTRKSERIQKTKKNVSAPPPQSLLDESKQPLPHLVDLVNEQNPSNNPLSSNNNYNSPPVVSINQTNPLTHPPNTTSPIVTPIMPNTMSTNVISVSVLPNSPNSNTIPNSSATVFPQPYTSTPFAVNSKKRNLNEPIPTQQGNNIPNNNNNTNGGTTNGNAQKTKKKKENIIARLEMKDSDEYFYDMTESDKFFVVGRIPSSSVPETPKDFVHIDLKNYKHAKMISRKHLKVSYNPEKKKFFVHILGRNGVLFSGQRYSKGDNVEVKKKTKHH